MMAMQIDTTHMIGSKFGERNVRNLSQKDFFRQNDDMDY